MLPRASMEIRDRRPLHGLPTTRLALGKNISNPSFLIGICIISFKKCTALLVTNIFRGKLILLMAAKGSGTIKIKKDSGNIISLVIFLPYKNKLIQKTSNIMEKPLIKNTPAKMLTRWIKNAAIINPKPQYVVSL
jgi:hypothetical protein